MVRQTGVHEKEAARVSCTVWPPHEHIALSKGDIVAVEGKFSQNNGTDSNGAPVTYNNLSVSTLAVLGHADPGQKPGVENAVDETTDEDCPF